jgi:hypothetical protein
MTLRHKNYVDTYDKIGVWIPTRHKSKLQEMKECNGVSMTHIVTQLLDKFFSGEIEIKTVLPAKIHSYRRSEK